MSAPEANALPPAPVTTITRIDLSARKSCIASIAALHISSEIALWRSTLLRVIQPTPFSFFAMIFSLRINAFPFLLPHGGFHLATHAHRGIVRIERHVAPLHRLPRGHGAQHFPPVRQAER